MGMILESNKAMSTPNLLSKLATSRFAVASVVTAVITFGVASVSQEAQAFVLFANRTTFEDQLDNIIVDDYSNPGYLAGDSFDGATFDVHTDANMSSIVGETQYTSTGFDNNNIITNQSSGDFVYCTGCNGSFLLDFTSTSVGDSSGVFGVGFDIFGGQNVFGTIAFVTFGDGSTINLDIPDIPDINVGQQFWGMTSDLSISSIHFGLEDGGTNTNGAVQRMALDNLIIGSKSTQTIPEPSSLLAILAASGVGSVATRKKNSKS